MTFASVHASRRRIFRRSVGLSQQRVSSRALQGRSFHASSTRNFSLSFGPLSTIPGFQGHFFQRNGFMCADSTSAKRDTPSLSMLASSTAISKPPIIRRFLDWIKYWLGNFWQAVLVSSRVTEVCVRLSPLAILAPAAVVLESERLTEWAWQYTISTMQALGPVAVKFCQWIATRRDMFPPVLCDRLGVLHDSGYPHAWSHTHKMLTESFGNYRKKGLKIDEVIGCGSAAQVYRGRLETEDGNGETKSRPVAVKVLHPKFARSVDRDLSLMQSIADFLNSLPSETIKMVNLPRATQNFGEILRLQADLTNESKNLTTFRSNFYDSAEAEARSRIYFPNPVPGWSSEKALIEDYVQDATPISTFLNDSSPEGVELRKELSGPLLRGFLKMVFVRIPPDPIIQCFQACAQIVFLTFVSGILRLITLSMATCTRGTCS